MTQRPHEGGAYKIGKDGKLKLVARTIDTNGKAPAAPLAAAPAADAPKTKAKE